MTNRLRVAQLPARSMQLMQYGSTKVHHLPDWGGYDDPKKLEVIRKICMERGRNPFIAKKAVSILKKARVKPRQYKKQAAALLKWVQNPKNVYYVNEPGERLVDPVVTLKWGFGDCDDQVMVLCSFFESIRLPWRLVISGMDKRTGKKVRYIEGGTYPQNVKWSHIYCAVGIPAFNPKDWYFCECTVMGVPLGWDVVAGDPKYIPEMDMGRPGKPRIMKLKPKRKHTSAPSYGAPAFSSSSGASSVSSRVGEAIGGAIAVEEERIEGGIEFRNIAFGVVTGVCVAVGTQLALDWVKGEGLHSGSDPGHKKVINLLSDIGSFFENKSERV